MHENANRPARAKGDIVKKVFTPLSLWERTRVRVAALILLHVAAALSAAPVLVDAYN